MKTVLFLLASFLPMFAFTQPKVIHIPKKDPYNCRITAANQVECGRRSSSYYWQNKIVEETEERKVEIRLLMDKGLLIPALEESLSEGSDAVKVHSLRAKYLTEADQILGIGFVFFLNMEISLKNESYSVDCLMSIHSDTYSNSLTVAKCAEERELLTFDQDKILSIGNQKPNRYGWGKKLVSELDYYRPIVRITQITRKRGSCQSKVFFTEEGCPQYEKDEISKTGAGVYLEK